MIGFMQGIRPRVSNLLGLGAGVGAWLADPTTVQAPSLVGPIYPVVTYAGLPAAGSSTGKMYRVSDVGNNTLWVSNGTFWQPANPGPLLLKSLDVSVLGLNNSEVINLQYLFPAAFLLAASDRLLLDATYNKSGTTDSALISWRLGTAGTTSDTQVVALTIMAAAIQSAALRHAIRVETATTTQILSSSLGYYVGSSSALAGAVTVSNVSNPLYLSTSVRSSSTNNTVGFVDGALYLIRKSG